MQPKANIKSDQILSFYEHINNEINKVMCTGNDDLIRQLVDERRFLLARIEQNTSGSSSATTTKALLNRNGIKGLEKKIETWCSRITKLTKQEIPNSGRVLFDLLLDFTLPKKWDFENDTIVLLHPKANYNVEALVQRGQKNIVIFDEKSLFSSRLPSRDQSVKIRHCSSIKEIEIAFATIQSANDQILTVPCYSGNLLDTNLRTSLKDAISRGKKNRVANTITANKFGWEWSSNLIRNLPRLPDCPNLHQLAIQGFKHAVIVASGPSLTKNIKTLKKIQNSVFVVAALRSLPVLENAGIVPDLVIQLDAENEMVAKNLQKLTTTKITNLLLELTVNPKFFELSYDNVIYSIPSLFSDVNKRLNIKPTPFDAPSVSIYALSLCYILGFKNICFVGQDLASSGGRQYAKGATSLLPAHTDLNMFNIEVPAFDGSTVFTRSAYFHQIKRCENIARDIFEKDKNVNLLNATEGGAFIKGFRHLSLKEYASERGLWGRQTKIGSLVTGSATVTNNQVKEQLETWKHSFSEIKKLTLDILEAERSIYSRAPVPSSTERLVRTFKNYARQLSVLQVAMQDDISSVIGTSPSKSEISCYSDFFVKVEKRISEFEKILTN